MQRYHSNVTQLLKLQQLKNGFKSSFSFNNNSSQQQRNFHFELIHESKKSRARVGRIHTEHGIIETPTFVPVGTNGTLKAVDNHLLELLLPREKNEHVQLMFCNTYHLLVHPGTQVIANAGGLHKFIGRRDPIITDSGGFQVFSLAKAAALAEARELMQNNEVARANQLLDDMKELKGQHFRPEHAESLVMKIDEDGVKFRSYRDGTIIHLSPETSVDAQKQFGSDIIIPFDELLPNATDMNKLRQSLDRTHRWEKRSLERHLQNKGYQAMYAVLHGGTNLELRQFSIDTLTKLPFDGYAIGGSLGRNRSEMFELLQYVMPRIPQDKPNHVLGIADLESVQQLITFGVDTFDSAYPTRLGRHGNFFHSTEGVVNVRSIEKYMNATSEPIDKNCECYTCKHYSAGYLHHLYKMCEPVLGTLGSIHNVHFLTRLMAQVRQKILNDEI